MAKPSPVAPSGVPDASAADVEYLLSLAEQLNTSYRRARVGAFALVLLAAFVLLIAASYLYDLVSSHLTQQLFRDPRITAIVTALFAMLGIAVYTGLLLLKVSQRDRFTLYEIARTLHEVVPVASEQGNWSQLYKFAFKMRLSRLGLEPYLRREWHS